MRAFAEDSTYKFFLRRKCGNAKTTPSLLFIRTDRGVLAATLRKNKFRIAQSLVRYVHLNVGSSVLPPPTARVLGFGTTNQLRGLDCRNAEGTCRNRLYSWAYRSSRFYFWLTHRSFGYFCLKVERWRRSPLKDPAEHKKHRAPKTADQQQDSKNGFDVHPESFSLLRCAKHAFRFLDGYQWTLVPGF